MDKDKLLKLYDLLPFEHHPLWVKIRAGQLSLEQVLKAETQHWLRSRAGRPLRKEAMETARGSSESIFQELLKTYFEECTHDASGPSHLDLIQRLLTEGGIRFVDLENAVPTPGNSAAIALYKDISSRGAGCHMIGAGVVEHYYSKLCPSIFDAYLKHYKMTPDQAETYRIHGPMDAEHADRAFAVLDEILRIHGAQAVEQCVRDAFVATSLHYDGMLHAATGELSYWNGKY